MSFELAPFGIGIKTVLPGGMNRDFFGSMVIGHHSAYEADADRILSAFRDPLPVALVWRKDNTSPLLEQFITDVQHLPAVQVLSKK